MTIEKGLTNPQMTEGQETVIRRHIRLLRLQDERVKGGEQHEHADTVWAALSGD